MTSVSLPARQNVPQVGNPDRAGGDSSTLVVDRPDPSIEGCQPLVRAPTSRCRVLTDRPRLDPDAVAVALHDPARADLLARCGLAARCPEPAFDRWTRLAARSVRATHAFITVFEGEDCIVKSVFGVEGVAVGRALPVGDVVCRYVLGLDGPLAIDDLRAEPGLRDEIAVVRRGLAGYVSVPIRVQDAVLGTLCVADRAPRRWTEEDLGLLGDLADGIAGEVALRLGADELRRTRDVVASHNRAHELIGAGAPLEQVLEEVAFSIERYDPELRGSILLLDDELRTVHHAAGPNLPRAYLAALDGMVADPEIGSCGPAACHGIEVITEDIERDSRWASLLDLTRDVGLRHCWSFPVFGDGGRVVGTFGVYGAQPRRPTAEHLGFLRDAARLAGIAIDRARAGEELVQRATHDALTGLPNRTLLVDRLTQALARSRRSGTAVGVLLVDIDRLKLVNGRLGHEAGDEVLRAVARRLAGVVRPGDTVARFTGDQFVVVAEDVDARDAAVIGQRIVAAVADPSGHHALHGLHPTATVGIAVVSGRDVDAREAIRHAADAVDLGKDEGGNRVRAAARDTGADAGDRRRAIEAALHGALERGEFRLLGQPIVACGRWEASGLEMLLRWTSPELGVVGPDEFVPIAEQTGLIDELGRWIVREAVAAVVALQETLGHPVHVGVNVSPRQLRDPGFTTEVRRACAAAGLPLHQLVVEITETALLGSDAATTRSLEELSAMGVELVLDDFGTGFSSLAMLKDRPIDAIKIDRSFVAGLPHDASSRAIVEAVVGMAHALGRSVTAEGIETPEQLAWLRDLGCRFFQGYLLYRPLELGELAAAMATPPAIAWPAAS